MSLLLQASSLGLGSLKGVLAFAVPYLKGEYRFFTPEAFPLLLALPLVLWLRRTRRTQVMVVPFAAAWHRGSIASIPRLPALLATLGTALLIVGLARPQSVDERHQVHTEGYDLVLAIDLSSSMLSEDYVRDGKRINRIDAIRPVIQSFINKRPNDRIGIVLFAGHAYTMAPLTLDHDWLSRQVDRIRIGLIEDRTAIGDGLGISLSRLEQANRMKDGKRLGAFVVLLTDGGNNAGALQPSQAADIAVSRHIPIYTIGAGREGYVPVPIGRRPDGTVQYDMQFSAVDEVLLRNISAQTGGLFFRAMDSNAIENAFKAIDKAQKIEFQGTTQLETTELFAWFAAPGTFLLLLAAWLLRQSSPRSTLIQS